MAEKTCDLCGQPGDIIHFENDLSRRGKRNNHIEAIDVCRRCFEQVRREQERYGNRETVHGLAGES